MKYGKLQISSGDFRMCFAQSKIEETFLSEKGSLSNLSIYHVKLISGLDHETMEEIPVKILKLQKNYRIFKNSINSKLFKKYF